MIEKFSWKKLIEGLNIFNLVKLSKLVINLLPIIIIALVLWKIFLEPKLNQIQEQKIDLRGAKYFTLEAGQTQPPPEIPKRFGWISVSGQQEEFGTFYSVEIGKDFW